MTKTFKTILDQPVKVIIATILMAIPAVYCSTNLTVDSSTGIFLVEDDPEKKAYDEFVNKFGRDATLFVMVSAELKGAFSSLKFQGLSEKLKQVPGVISLYDPVEKYKDAIIEEAGEFTIAALKEKTGTNPFERFISFEKNYLVYAMRLGKLNHAQRKEVFERTRQALLDSGIEADSFYIAGQPVLNYFLGQTPREGIVLFFPILILISVAVLYYIFRCARLVLASMLLIFMAELFFFGLIGFTGKTLNVITSIAPAVLYTITLAASIHLLERLLTNHMEGGPLKESLALTMEEKFPPCLFAALTTAVGFGSLSLSPMLPIKSLGIYLFCGSLISFALLFTLFPALLALLLKDNILTPIFSLSRFFRATVEFTRARKTSILLLSALPVIYVIAKLPDITFQTNGLHYFKEDSAIRLNTKRFEEKGLGLVSMEIVLKAGKNDFKKIQILKELDSLSAELEGVEGVQRAYSVASMIKEANGIRNDFFDLPSGLAIDSFYRAIEDKNRDLLYSFTDPTFSTARVSLRLKTIGYDEYKKIRERVEDAFYKHPIARSVKMTVTGEFPLIMGIQKYLMATLLKSFAFSFTAILICFFLFIKRKGLAAASIAPNLFPIFCTAGLIFALRLDFDVGNIMIASVILGIAVDDTAHFLHQLNSGLMKKDIQEAIFHAYDKTGGAIFSTTLVLGSGFLIFGLSDFIPTRNFGLLSSFAIVSALVGDLLVLPAILFLFNKPLSMEAVN